MMNLMTGLLGLGGHLGGWRHKDAWSDNVMNLEHAIETAQTAERGKFDLLFLADGNAVRQMDKPALFAANSPSDRPAVFEPITLLSAVAQYTKQHRPAGHRDHDLRRALLARPQLRLARPSQRGPRLLEYRHHSVSRRLAQFQPHRTRRQRSATSARTSSSISPRAVGQLGRGRLHPEQGNRPVLRSRGVRALNHKGKHFSVKRPAQRRAHAAGLSGDVHRRPVRGRAASWRPAMPTCIFAVTNTKAPARPFTPT